MGDHVEISITDDEDGNIGDDVSSWSPDQVASWLRRKGYPEYADAAVNSVYPINGHRLLSLTRNDLLNSPFHMNDQTEADHLNNSIEALRKSQLTKYMKKIELNGLRNGYSKTSHGNCNGRLANGFASVKTPLLNGDTHHHHINDTTPFISGEDNIGNGGNNSNEQFPVEKLKTLVAVLYMMFGFVVSVVTLQFVHDRVPSMTEDPPLPDIFFDIVPRRIEGAFSYCESIGMVLTSFTILVAIFHKHRFIIMRRIFFILGTLYLYRSITIYVTTLPVPGLHFKCAPKANGHISLMLTRAASLLFGGGLSVTGSHHLCGDYLFSGHTIILVITYMTIHEYTPKRWWFLHWLCWVMSATGIVCILLAHDHYTIDVVVAYLLTTRLFWSYHTLCNVSVLKEYANSNLLSRAWWFPIFRYFEENVASTGCLPRQFEWPLPWPRRFRNNIAPGRRSPIKGV
ncbi:phosphatidylcholine:ceramide cholinephosphotransferase 2 isoform X2 [Ciona intestinalis]